MIRVLRLICTVLALLAALSRAALAGEEVLVAVASNFTTALQALARGFEAETGHRVKIATGSTGKLYAQISAGAPFQVFLAADQARPERLEAEGRAVPGTRFTYATGRLALWSADPGRAGGDMRAALTAPNLRHLAIANPELAPYGFAAREALEALGLWTALRPRVVMGQNAGQTFAMVATGNAELGFVPQAALVGRGGVRWDVPEGLHAPIRQDAVLLGPGAGHEGAQAFLDYLGSDAAAVVIRRHGYGRD